MLLADENAKMEISCLSISQSLKIPVDKKFNNSVLSDDSMITEIQ